MHLHVRLNSGVHQLFRGAPHGVFALATFNVLLCRLFAGVGVHPLAKIVNHDEGVASRLYAVFVGDGLYQMATILQFS